MTSPHYIYQVFTGRHEDASMIVHEGKVFDKLQTIDWNSFKEHGFDTVYLLGIFDHRGPICVETENGKPITGKRLPSPFAITNHTEPDPRLGKLESLQKLIELIHQAQLQMMVDFIPNHTGLAHPWITTHPEYYLEKTEFSGDVQKLNYANSELRREMIAVMDYIVSLGVDGMRVDMAHLIPTDFWEQTLAQIKHIKPNFFFMAEAYSSSVFNWTPLVDLQRSGFDAVYEEFFYRNLHAVYDQHSPFTYLVDHLHYLSLQDNVDKWVHYLSNHDDPLGTEVAPFHQAWTALLAVMPGSLMIPNGQLYGKATRLAHHSYDPLHTCDNELIQTPAWFNALITVIKTLHPTPKSIQLQNGLLVMNLDLNHKPGMLIINPTNDSLALPQQVLKPGLIHSTSHEMFLPGDYDFFFTE